MRDAHDVNMTLRTFRAADGTRWTVWRVEPSALLVQPGGPREWLVFVDERGAESRRLFEIPPNWESLSPERLDLLRRIAEPAPGRGPTSMPVGDDHLPAAATRRAANSRRF